MLASFQGYLFPVFALCTFHAQHNFLGSFGLNLQRTHVKPHFCVQLVLPYKGNIALHSLMHTYLNTDNKALKILLGKTSSELHCFSLHLEYSFPVTCTLSSVGKPSWSWIPTNHIQVQKENKILLLLAYVLHNSHNSHKSQQNHVVVSQKLPRNVQKGVLQVQSGCFVYVLIADCVVWS